MDERTDGGFLADFGSSSEPDAGRRARRDRRLLRLLLLLVVLLLGGLYAAGYLLTGDRLPRSTTIAGVDVGGLRPDRARVELARALAPRLDRPITVVVGERRFEVDPEEAGLDLDIPASVQQVPVGRSWDPGDMWETLTGGDDYDPVVVVVDDLLLRRVEEIAAAVRVAPVEGGVVFSRDGAEPTYPRPGERLPVDATVEAVREAFDRGTGPVALETEPERPRVDAAAVSEAMESFGNPAMSGPVTYLLGRRRVILRPADFAPALSMRVEGDRLVPRVSGPRLLRVVLPLVGDRVRAPREAGFRVVAGRAVVVPGATGLRLDEDRLARSFRRLVTRRDGRVGPLPANPVRPRLTTAEARGLGVSRLVAAATAVPPPVPGEEGTDRAAEALDGTVLEPGKVLGLLRLLGRDPRPGDGTDLVAGALYDAALRAGLEVVERHAHPSSGPFEPGRDAWVTGPGTDLRLRNDTRHGVLVRVLRDVDPSGGSRLTVQLWSTRTWDVQVRTGEPHSLTDPGTTYERGSGCVPRDGVPGYTVEVVREFRRPGERAVHHTETTPTTYAPSDTVLCR